MPASPTSSATPDPAEQTAVGSVRVVITGTSTHLRRSSSCPWRCPRRRREIDLRGAVVDPDPDHEHEFATCARPARHRRRPRGRRAADHRRPAGHRGVGRWTYVSDGQAEATGSVRSWSWADEPLATVGPDTAETSRASRSRSTCWPTTPTRSRTHRCDRRGRRPPPVPAVPPSTAASCSRPPAASSARRPSPNRVRRLDDPSPGDRHGHGHRDRAPAGAGRPLLHRRREPDGAGRVGGSQRQRRANQQLRGPGQRQGAARDTGRQRHDPGDRRPHQRGASTRSRSAR